MTDVPLDRESFVARLQEEGAKRYHDHHGFHLRMHAGGLSKRQLQAWVENRFYYQTRIPIKDAIILSRSEDRAFRRMWVHRITDHDGNSEEDGGIVQWLRLARGVGLHVEEVENFTHVLPGVRFACDAYLQLVRESPLVEAVASSLTEFFAPDIMARRVLAWETHYPWVDSETLAYFRTRVTRARRDSHEALDYVLQHASTRVAQERCVDALIRKTEILWALLDAVDRAFPDELPQPEAD